MSARCSGLEYFLFIYGSNSYVAAVAYLASEDVVLGHGCVSVFVLALHILSGKKQLTIWISCGICNHMKFTPGSSICI
jgi:hypothetical protein